MHQHQQQPYQGDAFPEQNFPIDPAPASTAEEAFHLHTAKVNEDFFAGLRATIEDCDNELARLHHAKQHIEQSCYGLEMRRQSAAAALNAVNADTQSVPGGRG